MTKRSLELFIAVCENENSITKAADKLMISQPSVTAAIRDIEGEYGVLLFDRLGKRLYLSEAGKNFYEYARRLNSLYEDMSRRFSNWGKAGLIRVGGSLTIGRYLLPTFVCRYRVENPDVDVRIVVEPSRELEKRILRNELDIAFVETQIHAPSLVVTPFLSEEMHIVAARKPGDKDEISMTFQELLSYRFLLREKGSGTREIFDRVIQDRGCMITPVMESTSADALLNMTATGFGVTVLPGRMADEAVTMGKVCRVNVRGLHFPQQFYLIHHKDKILPETVKELLAGVTGDRQSALVK